MKLTICHMYPAELNLYGDRGNIITLVKRCEWRGIETEVVSLEPGDIFRKEDYDIVFFGGGQDFEQNLIKDDLLLVQKENLKSAVDDGIVFLCICGGYQMMGEYYIDQKGNRLECVGAIPVRTDTGPKRLIGNIICETMNSNEILVGFENHSGRTYLQEGATPLAKVVKGFGNNGIDGTEGARYKNVFCTYMHGSFLPKNPSVADELICMALKNRYSYNGELSKLDDDFELNARNAVISCK